MKKGKMLLTNDDNTCSQCGAVMVGNGLDMPLYCLNGHLYKEEE
jgi:hypothetical protein